MCNTGTGDAGNTGTGAAGNTGSGAGGSQLPIPSPSPVNTAPSTYSSPSPSTSTKISSIHRDAFNNLDDLSPKTWPEYKPLILSVLGSYADYYLNGDIERENYTREIVKGYIVTRNEAKLKEFDQWRHLAETIKLIVQTYGGNEAKSRIESMDTSLGDAPGIWKCLNSWYGGLGTGAEKVSILLEIVNTTWTESDGHPSLFFTKMEGLKYRLNAYYRAEAKALGDTHDPNVIALSCAALAEQVLRDLLLLRLPTEYSQSLSPQMKLETNWSSFKELVIGLYEVRQLNENIQANRVVALRAEEQKKEQSGGKGKNRPRHSRRGGGPSKKAATEFKNYESWPFGFFKDKSGKQRFKIERGSCFRCFKDGHLVGQCPLEDQSPQAARSRLEEMKRYKIDVDLKDAFALLVFDSNIGASRDADEIDALVALAENNLTLQSNVDTTSYASFVSLASPSSSSTLPEPFVDTSSFAFRVTTSSNSYILDSGASRSFSTQLNHFYDYTPYSEPKKIGGAFASSGDALGEGRVALKSKTGKTLFLDGVMYAPKLGVNLISWTRLMMAGWSFSNVDNTSVLQVFDPSRTHVFDLSVSPTMEIEASRFVFPSSPTSPLALVISPDTLLLEHRRAGHPSDQRLKKRIGGNWTEKVSSRCSECAMGKATRKGVSKTSDSRAMRKLERISADTWGPSPVRGLKGEKYAVLMLDAWSRYAWVELVPSKGGIEELVKQRIKREERSEGIKVVAFQSDNGTEFVNKNLDSWLAREGIQHRLTVPYVHGQNGLVEVRWRHLLETTRTMLLTSNLPLSFWSHALDTAVYLYNHTPSSAIDFDTPAHRYQNVDSSKIELKVWGCVAWLSLPREGSYRVNKLGARAVKARFIGYLEDRKGWKFWVPEWRKIVVWYGVERWDELQFGTDGSTKDDEGDRKRWLERFEDEVEEPSQLAAEGGRGIAVERHQEAQVQPQPQPQIATENRFDVLPQDQIPEPEDEEIAIPRQETPVRSPTPEIPPPPPPPAPAPRRSGRLAGAEPTHYVPLAGAPANPTPDQALRVTLANSTSPPKPSSPLALALFDPELHHDSEAVACATFDLESDSSPLELDIALDLALSTSPAWTGSYDAPTYNQARNRPDYDKWNEAMLAELAAFEATGTWEEDLVELPPDRRAISVKWVLLIKRDSEGRILKYKARLVARGDMQIDGVDYDETHSSTVRLTSVRLILALLAAHPEWKWAQFDISNAYLLGVLDREIYVKQAPGFTDASRPKAVRRLKKALYGLRQGGREWQKVLRGALENVGFKRLDADHGMYVRRRGGKVLIVPTHVDDGLVVGDDDIDEALEEINAQLEGKLKKIETGLFLGMKINRFEDGSIDVSQAHYLRNVLDRFFPEGLSPVLTPLDSSYTSITAATEDERFDCPYRELLGALVYLSSCTHPDLAFALSFASRFASCPAKRHWTALKHICRYLAGSLNFGLRYLTPSIPFDSTLVTGWSDADHGADKDTRRSVSGYVFNVGEDSLLSAAISWLSRRQKSVAISSCEAEYMAFSEASREALWLRQLLRELGFPTPSPTLIRGDNTGSLLLASHPTSHSRTKHIDIHYHFTRELVNDEKVILKWVPTADMVADVFTKGLGREKHFFFRRRCGLMDLRREGGCEKVKEERSEDAKG